MRVGLIADVHANLPALEAVLDVLGREQVDGIICAGDLVGYGPFPNEVIERVGEACDPCVVGNHDLAAIGALPFEAWPPLARETLAWTAPALTEQSRRVLAALPVLAGRAEGVAVAHGSVDDPEVYVRSTEDALQQLAATSADVLVLGHTHQQLAVAERSGALLAGRAGTVRLPAGERVVLNPGSVGQSRDGRVRARFALLDLTARVADFREVRYDWRETREALRRAGLPRSSYHLKIDTVPRRALGRVRRVAARARGRAGIFGHCI